MSPACCQIQGSAVPAQTPLRSSSPGAIWPRILHDRAWGNTDHPDLARPDRDPSEQLPAPNGGSFAAALHAAYGSCPAPAI